ncbi:M48 family metallopeptidase [Thermaurantiacus sp.]
MLPSHLVLAGRLVPLAVRRSRAARRIVIRPCAESRTIRLSLPARAPLAAGLQLLRANHAWLEQQVEARFPAPQPFRPGGSVPFGDAALRIVPVPGRGVRRAGYALLVGTDGSDVNRQVLRWLRREARRQLEEEARALAEPAGLLVRSVRVGDPRRRWGSCSARGGLSFSWRLVMAPSAVRRAVVAHEVAHLAHFDHSERFWELAARLHGGPLGPSQHWLAANGARLHALGAVHQA